MPVYFLEGPRRWAESWIDQNLSVEEKIQIHPEAVEKGMLAAECAAQGFFASSKAIVLLDWATMPKWMAAEWTSLAHVDPETHIVLRVSAGESKKLPTKGLSADRKEAFGAIPASQHIDRLLKHHGVSVEAPQLQSFLESIVDQFDQIVEVVEKAALQEDKTITKEWLQSNSAFEIAANPFDLMDALAANHTRKVFEQLDVLEEGARKALPQIVGGIAYKLRIWMKKRTFGFGALRRVHKELVALDRKSKSSPVAGDVLLREFAHTVLYVLHNQRPQRK